MVELKQERHQEKWEGEGKGKGKETSRSLSPHCNTEAQKRGFISFHFMQSGPLRRFSVQCPVSVSSVSVQCPVVVETTNMQCAAALSRAIV